MDTDGSSAGTRGGGSGHPGAGALPNLIVIGAMKCGTSSLHYYLGLHPEISMSSRKELNFFLDPAPTPPAGCGDRDRSLLGQRSSSSRGLAWYASRFDDRAPVRGETSVAYSFPWYPGVAERIAGVVPEAKLIYCVRHPIERITSHLAQFRRRDGRPFAEAVALPGNPYVEASRYASALVPFLDRFEREQLLVVRQDDLLKRRRDTVAAAFRFLGVDDTFWSPQMERERNPTVTKGTAYRIAERARSGPVRSAIVARIPRSIRAVVEQQFAKRATAPGPVLDRPVAERILDLLEPEIARLEELGGWDLASWREPQPQAE
jgi:hypothetical protein